MSQIPAGFVRLEKSERHVAPNATLLGPAKADEVMLVSVRLRRRTDAPALPDLEYWASTPVTKRKYLTREDFAGKYGAHPDDLGKVEAFAKNANLTIVDSSIPRRTVKLSGTVAQINAAFGVTLGHYKTEKEEYRGREGFIHIPPALNGIVEGVFGLDNRQMARRAGGGGTITTLNPMQVAKLYNFPTAATGSGQTIALLEFGGGYRTTDISDYFTTNIGIGPGHSTPALTAIGVNGATNSPDNTNSTAEVTLDISVAGAVAQGAKIAVYFAPFTEQGWVDIVTAAVQDVQAMPSGWKMPSVISISWAWGEFESLGSLTWSQAAIDAVSQTFQEAAALGVTVFAASGDNGSDCQIGDGKAHCYYPASDPWITCCGGTTIENVSGSSFKEITWNDNGVTGGGISDVFPVPSFQVGHGIPKSINPNGRVGRGIPDISGYANGYNIVLAGAASNGWWGTSETAPLYAGLIAQINSANGFPCGYINPILYKFATSVITDINDGATNKDGSAPGYTCGPGWDACTGLGRVNGTALMNEMKSQGEEFGDVFNISATAWAANRLDVFVKGTDNALYHKYWNGSAWAAYENLGGILTSAPKAVSWGPNRLDIFAKGTDNALWHKYWNGSTWSGWESLGGILVGQPNPVSWGPNRLDVFVQGTNNALFHKYWNGSAWSGWENLGGILISAPVPVSWGPNRIDVFVMGTDRAMYHKAWNGSAWVGYDNLGGVLTGVPCPVSWAANRLDIFGKGSDDALYHKWFSGSWQGWEDLGGIIAA